MFGFWEKEPIIPRHIYGAGKIVMLRKNEVPVFIHANQRIPNARLTPAQFREQLGILLGDAQLSAANAPEDAELRAWVMAGTHLAMASAIVGKLENPLAAGDGGVQALVGLQALVAGPVKVVTQ